MPKAEISVVDVCRFYHHMKQIKESVQAAYDLIPKLLHGHEMARGYWYAHITMEIDNNHNFLGDSMCTMEKTLWQLYSLVSEESEGPTEDDFAMDEDLSGDDLSQLWHEVMQLVEEEE